MISIQRILERLDKLATFNATPGEGVTRLSFTPEDRAARQWFMEEAESLGMSVRVDGAANIFARLGGDGPAVLSGSHLDTVPHGGRYDGALGVIAALEVAQVLKETSARLVRPYEVVVWADEEGGRFGTGLLGSRAAIGVLTSEELDTTRDKDGILLRDALRPFAHGTLASAELDPANYHAYLEVHIEQGSRLIDEGYQVGLVEGIVGISRLVVNLTGQANHAGTTPMNRRRDALVAASNIVLAVRELGLRSMPGVATVGQLKISPGAANVIPGEVTLTIEMRHLEESVLDRMVDEARELVKRIAYNDGVDYAATLLKSSRPCLTDERLKKILRESIVDLGLQFLALPSGAGHDAQSVAKIMPAAMLFVPSIGGISHSPLEESKPEDVESAIAVLYGAAKRLVSLG